MNKALKRERDFVGQGNVGRCIGRRCNVEIRESNARSLSNPVSVRSILGMKFLKWVGEL